MNLAVIGFRYARIVFAVLLILMIAGGISYFKMPANEDPSIIIRQALLVTHNPGMPTKKVEMLITKPLELAIRKRPEIKKIQSTTSRGQSIIMIEMLDKYFDLKQIWDDVRDEIAQVRLPAGTSVPILNDSFGDVSVFTIALMSDDGFSNSEKTAHAQHIRDRLYEVTDTQKVDLLGIRPERIYIDISNSKVAELGYTPQQLAQFIGSQNIIQSGGNLDINGTTITLQPTGNFKDIQSIQSLLIPLPDNVGMISLSDIATVHRSVIDPPSRPVYFNGKPVQMFAITMDPAANLLEYSPRMEAKLAEINANLPAGMRLEIATKQATQVAKAVYGVTASVMQTLLIVLVVVMLFLGLRTGLIVGSVVPAVMLLTLAVMQISGMSLQRMSLATLIIALGLLVDNGIVIAEDFRHRLERGISRDDALKQGGRVLAIPLLTSSLSTILVFLPLLLAVHVAGEYTRSISIVILVVLLTSWLLAMMVTPTLCYHFMKVKPIAPDEKPFSIFNPIRNIYAGLLRVVLRFRVLFLIAIVFILVGTGKLMTTVPQKFFPDSDRTQILVYLTQPAQTSMRETARLLEQVSPEFLDKKRFPHVQSVAAYGGFGGPRFVLSLTPILPADNRAFMVLNVDKLDNMAQTIEKTTELFQDEYPNVQAQVMRMFLGPTDANILQIRVTGPDADVLFDTAKTLKAYMEKQPDTVDVRIDWQNRITAFDIVINQQQAKAVNISSADIAESLRSYYSGMTVSTYREGDEQLPIVLRANTDERNELSRLYSTQVYSSMTRKSVPLSQIATIQPVNQYSHVMRENLIRSIIVEARNTKLSAEEIKPHVDADIQKIAQTLPPEHHISYDGAVKMSLEAQQALSANFPLCMGAIVILMIAQFNSYRRAVLVLLTVPLMMVGAVVGLKVMSAEFGFMVSLGLYSLAGIIVNNAILLIDRIDAERRLLKKDPYRHNSEHDALVFASVRRLRPIIMTTVTTMFGLLPLMINKDPLFYGMATVIAFGLGIGAILTLFFTPVVYTLFFKVRRAQDEYEDDDESYDESGDENEDDTTDDNSKPSLPQIMSATDTSH